MILQYTSLLATYCNSYEFFLEYIVQLSPFSHIITVPPDRWNLFNRLLHFFSIVSFSDESDFNQTGNISPQKSTPGGQSLHSGTVVSAVSFIDPADCSVRDFTPLLIQVTNSEKRGRRI